MYKINKVEVSEKNLKFRIYTGNEFLTHQIFLRLLGNSDSFRVFYSNMLSNCGFDAFIWENKPITNNNLNDLYECNIIDCPFLAGQSSDEQTFGDYFDPQKNIVSFKNLGNDAQLVVPTPKSTSNCYTHIGNFVRCNNIEQKDAFWKTIAIETLKRISNEPLWLSTSGLGVFWLHARIDSFPKYYQTEEYKIT